MRQIKIFIGIALLFLVILFVLQNVEPVTLQFLLWSFSLSRALMFFIIFALGIIVGWALGSLSRGRPR
ncbi:MAG: LapA family protein [Candidatus Manganitrophus sp.]|nr:LapA family protein [Candidatus Manganitrophus morganii]MDC4204909.1 LapA family protein [Candidatus Manganitrophus sp.]MDC4224319.1 LapA family protein [Candidatus Manganitrophus sp.]WDT70424.1 MAG: LapA family protein [Candidatus Manganitrophus sp.]WDT82344.1 MAG: LapA family protein [Candidatus Manganitrophus sp.]